MKQLFRELKRRNVYQVAVTYAVVAFVVWQVADFLFPALDFPAWTVDFVVVLSVLGFPIALVLAWAFEVTPEGVRRTADAEAPAEEPLSTEDRRSQSRLAMSALVGLGLVGAAVAGGWYLTGGGGEPSAEVRLGERSIAVLPFEALGQEVRGPFTEGMHDDLLARLSNVSDFKVISRTTVRRYRDSDLTTAEIAEELGVRWVLEGGVQEMGEEIQVNAQLIDPRSDTHAWAESYRRDLTAVSLFDLQSEITRRIVRSLEAELTSGERDRVERQPTDDLEAYRLYARGRTHLDRRTESGMRQAEDYFRQAIEADSAYAPAWSGLADARNLLVSYDYAPADSLLPRALEAARRALEIDPELAEAHASLGQIHQRERGGPAALRALRRAVELKPSYARAYHWLGLLLSTLGRQEEGLRHLERAVELDPMSPPIRLALAGAYYYYAGQLDEALTEARRSEELSPSYTSAPLYTGIILSSMGRHREAAEALQRVFERTTPSPWTSTATRGWLAIAHHRAGETERARDLLDEVERAAEFPFVAAVVHAELGQRDAAIQALEEADYDYLVTVALRYEPVFEPLRDDSRFQRLLRRVNREWGLNPDGSLPEGADVSFEAPPDA